MNGVKNYTKCAIGIFIAIFALVFFNLDLTAVAQEDTGGGTGILDTVAPTLQSFSIETDSMDAPGSIEIVAEATDDISGVSSVDVSFYNEAADKTIGGHCVYNGIYSGYIQYDDGKYHGHILTYQETKAGVYKLDSISVTDKAGNRRRYSADDEPIPASIAGLTITVTNKLSEDVTPPTLQSFSIASDSMDAPAGNEIVAEATDDISGVDYIDVAYYNEVADKTIYGHCAYNGIYDGIYTRSVQYNDGKYHGFIVTYQDTKAGVYTLSSITVSDKAGNRRTYSAEKEPLPAFIATRTITVTNKFSDDTQAPVIQDVSLSTTELTVPGSISATATIVDDFSGPQYLDLSFFNKTYSKYINIHFEKAYYEDGAIKTSEDGNFRKTIYLNQYTRPGEYVLIHAGVRDNAGNRAVYDPDDPSSPLYEMFKGWSIIVHNAGAGATLVASTNTQNLAERIKEQPFEAAILIDYSNNSVVKGDVFDAIKGTNKTLILESSGAQWIFEGKNITGESKDIDLDVKVQTLDEKAEVDNIENIITTIGEQPAVVLTFPENGTLPGSAKIRIKADARMIKYLGQDGLYAYYMDNATGKMVQVAEKLSVTTDSFIEFDITHCSNYIIVQGELQDLTIKGTQNKNQTDNGNGIPFIIKPGSSDEDEGSSNSDSNEEDTSKAVSEWKPITPDEQKRYAVVGKEHVVLTADAKNVYSLTAYNMMQGSQCFKSFESALNGYTIGRTYDILPNNKRVQEMNKEATFTLRIPTELQKDGRDFKMICVTKDGKPVVLKDLDKDSSTITVKTKKYYAFALVYKDTKTR